jgi:hypothetical protein
MIDAGESGHYFCAACQAFSLRIHILPLGEPGSVWITNKPMLGFEMRSNDNSAGKKMAGQVPIVISYRSIVICHFPEQIAPV